MRLHFLVNYEDKPDAEPQEVVAWDTDIVALETTYDIDVSVFQQRQRFEWFAFLAWHALKRKGLADGFDAWLSRGVEVDVKNEEALTGDGEPDPEASGERVAS